MEVDLVSVILRGSAIWAIYLVLVSQMIEIKKKNQNWW